MTSRNPYQFVSHDSRLYDLSRDRSRTKIRVVIFGGTGAVGGAVVLQLVRETLALNQLREAGGIESPLELDIVATGLGDKDIAYFVNRLFLSFEENDSDYQMEKVRPLREYRLGPQVRVRFRHFRVAIDDDSVRGVASRAGAPDFDLQNELHSVYDGLSRPFASFVEDFGEVDGVVVAIPIASVMAYTMGILDELTDLQENGQDERFSLKEDFLRQVVVGDLEEVSERFSREVIIAHTTAVGGMYRVDGEGEQIALGFAHSASGKLLYEKKHFADFLTEVYRESGFKVLITAAAIGIDAVMFHARLPASRAIHALLEARRSVDRIDLEGSRATSIWLYPGRRIDDIFTSGRPLDFGQGRDLFVDVAIRSGENGLFSIDNCYALYNVMKVTVPEELALVVSRQVLFGDEPHRRHFTAGACYFTETENARFALQVLSSDERLNRSQLGALSIKAYQALGSSTHQGRLHELGLVILLLRLSSLDLMAHPEETLDHALADLDSFLWENTSPPYFEDFLTWDLEETALRFGNLLEVKGPEEMGRLLGFEIRTMGRRIPTLEKVLARLATRIGIYRSMITSLGIPILYRRPTGEDALLVGPYMAPLDIAIGHTSDLARTLEERARPHGLDPRIVWDWVAVNNGIVDLRPHALATTAKDLGPDLPEQVARLGNEAELSAWLERVPRGHYFTTTGLVALRFRLARLWESVRHRQIELGTAETWKNLFKRDQNEKFLLVPGMIETIRMYSEGLGKTTGSETLWPGHGY